CRDGLDLRDLLIHDLEAHDEQHRRSDFFDDDGRTGHPGALVENVLAIGAQPRDRSQQADVRERLLDAVLRHAHRARDGHLARIVLEQRMEEGSHRAVQALAVALVGLSRRGFTDRHGHARDQADSEPGRRFHFSSPSAVLRCQTRCMNLNTSSCCASILSPISSPLATSRRFNSSNGTVAFSRSAIMIIVKNSRSVVCEMSTMFAFASASTADTLAMMPTVSAPMTVTMMRFDLLGICVSV